jgi:hypothetical protein
MGSNSTVIVNEELEMMWGINDSCLFLVAVSGTGEKQRKTSASVGRY